MSTKKTAPAEQEVMAKSAPAPRVVEGVTLTRLPLKDNTPGHPVAMFKGQAPKSGECLEFTLENGVTYRGTVAEATEAAGEVMAEFADSLTPVLDAAS